MRNHTRPVLRATVMCFLMIFILNGCTFPWQGNTGTDGTSASGSGADSVSGDSVSSQAAEGDSTGTGSEDFKGIRVVLTAGFKKNELFRIETISCMKPEIMVYLANMQNKYTAVYGSSIWKTSTDGVSFGESVRENALARITRIKAMNLMAQKDRVVLDGSENSKVNAAADEYFKSLSENDINKLGATKELIRSMYGEYALADKVYSYIIKDINPEVSDDEARTITVSEILIKTYSTTAKGDRVEFTAAEKEDAGKKCEDILSQLSAGEDFDKMARKYNEDTENTLSFGKGQVDKSFEDAAFNLGKGETSGVVETKDGYRIIKCITPFDKEQTEANKVNIVKEKRQEVFSKEYNAFSEPLTRCLNEKLWNEINITDESKVTTSGFFDIYRKYFPSETE